MLNCSFKSRLVAKGYSQRRGLDFYRRHSCLLYVFVDSNSIDSCCTEGYDCSSDGCGHFFSYGELEEEIYMQQPDGYQVSGKENLV